MNKGFFYAFLLALQFGIQPLLFTRFVDPNVQKFSLIIVTEICKIIIAVASFMTMSHDELSQLWHSWSLRDSLANIAPPAVLYAIQNILVQASYHHNINSMIFNLLNQTKTMSAAFWIYIILGKGQSNMQMLALLLLFISAVVLNIDTFGSEAIKNFINLWSGDEEKIEIDDAGPCTIFSTLLEKQNIAVACVLAASMISGLSAALTQKVLTKRANSLLVSAQLAIYGIVFLIIKEIFWDLREVHPAEAASLVFNCDTFWRGWDLWILLPVLASALGGIIIGLVTQHAGSIVKGFALIFGLIFTALIQWIVDGKCLKTNDWIALGLVSISIYLHTSYPLREKKKQD